MRSPATDGRLHLRYSCDCVGDAYLQMGTPPPPFDALRIPTLVVVGSLSSRHDGRAGRALPARAR